MTNLVAVFKSSPFTALLDLHYILIEILNFREMSGTQNL